jgi:hypothetical protein
MISHIYLQSHKNSTIDPDFLKWVEHCMPKEDCKTRTICEKILRDKETCNLSVEELTLFKEKILQPNIIKSTCGVCYSTFSWREHITALEEGDRGKIHAHCEKEIKLQMLRNINYRKSQRTPNNVLTMSKGEN